MNFDAIRSYNDDEIPAGLERLSQNKQFMNVLSTIYPLIPKDALRQRLTSFKSKNDFQKIMIYPFLQYLEANMTKGIHLKGREKLQEGRNYLYVSNHRDIILDSALLCAKFLENGLDTVEIAIGDNLLIFPWIEDLVRINKSFIVRRSPGAKQMLESSRQMAQYMKYIINEKGQSAWIAQREGRAKDSNDQTQESLLKMFNLCGDGTFAENLSELHICPLSISYEFDPCDYLKAKEFQQKRDNPEFRKSPQDDLLNMKTGVMGYKGKVVYTLAGEISEEIQQLASTITNRNELVSATAALIDSHIYRNYSIFNVNKIAFDLLEQSNRFASEYSLMEKLDFEKYLGKQIEKIDLDNKDVDFLMIKLLEMYANPLKNYLSVTQDLHH
ncbi:MAG: 1-acyl-sn-glycerol-3-phosphate acyltransferase [Paludibacter sp.]|jgi:hypothetical protein|nr:1-acyl-sn-glycerol-3-phosphate acyltransferase [Paludibacter sp.]